jgi:MYXO-CTERM domain-containing protein
MRLRLSVVLVCSLMVVHMSRATHAATPRTFATGSLIIPMDLAYQDLGMFQAYGLLFQLLHKGVPVAWVIDPDKTWHDEPCNTAGKTCAWDCAVEGSGTKCPYPTASPDFMAATKVVWDDQGKLTAGSAISKHGYRGGPFVVDAANRTAALAVINAWNDKTQWAKNTWAKRTVFQVVSVHEATASFQGHVAKEMAAAPTIAVFSDGNENIATSYLLAAGIPQSNGSEYPTVKCDKGACGPGTQNPDMLTVQSIMGEMGTCDKPNTNHKNGSLFTKDGLPAYCQIMSMHWDVKDRETVECDNGACPATQAACSGKKITYHGHEVVAEVRQFLNYPTHFFAECQAVNAYENTTPNTAWPYLDDKDRDGHFLTKVGKPPLCPCTGAKFECVTGGCSGADCCLPKDDKEKGAGFLIAPQPDEKTIMVLRPNVPYNQLDGAFGTVGGSEPAYSVSTYFGTKYKNDRKVVFITAPKASGEQDVWMTGYIDGLCDINCKVGEECFKKNKDCATGGKVSYLGGHKYETKVPLSTSVDSQGTRLFLNALFEADCVTSAGQPKIALSLTGDLVVAAKSLPVTKEYLVGYANSAAGAALAAVLRLSVPSGVTVTKVESGGTIASPGASWAIGSISGVPTPTGDPPASGSRSSTLSFSAWGEVKVTVDLDYRVGASDLKAVPTTVTIQVKKDSDGDGVPDDTDPSPNDAKLCGDSDKDNCDDCSSGSYDPSNDGPDADKDGMCDAATDPTDPEADEGGCGCRVTAAPRWTALGLAALGLALVVLWRSRRRPR